MLLLYPVNAVDLDSFPTLCEGKSVYGLSWDILEETDRLHLVVNDVLSWQETTAQELRGIASNARGKLCCLQPQ